MVFASPLFLFAFLPAVLLLHALVPPAWRNALLVLSSAVFYLWGEGANILIVAALIAVNWVAGVGLAHEARPQLRLFLLCAAVVADLGVLIFYKYIAFLAGAAMALAANLGWDGFPVDTGPLPLGISFFTFHLLSYVIDIYRRAAPAQRKPVDFALYISFFPQLVAGPIVRYHDIAGQLARRGLSLAQMASGAERFTLGLGKKVLLANPMGQVADQVFAASAADLTTPLAWLGIVAYTLQIYLDFSGYSDMAIGLARMFGFSFLENFNYPYAARSMREFWRRWHISLSNWFRDYLYIPLGGDRRGALRTAFNLLAVFVLCGLWHGANWTFLVWGLIHGAFLGLERGRFGEQLARCPRAVRHIYTLSIVMVAWVFFRSDTLTMAMHYIGALAGAGAADDQGLLANLLNRKTIIVMAAAVIASSPAPAMLARLVAPSSAALLRPAAVAAVLLLSAAFLAGASYNPFIYFRF